MGLLKNKIAIITGGGRGIGKAIANQYYEQGATVIIAEFDENSGKDTAENIGAYFFKTDIGDEKEVASLFEYVKTRFSRLDILVNNAGVLDDSTLNNLESNQFDSVIDVNLRGTYLCGKKAADIMVEQKSGVILNAASVVAHNGNFGQTNYSASKAGVEAFSRSLAKELGSRNITVNSVAPGFIQTDMTQGLIDKEITKKIPLQRVGSVEDVASLINFLVSEESNYITGQTLVVDGGLFMK